MNDGKGLPVGPSNQEENFFLKVRTPLFRAPPPHTHSHTHPSTPSLSTRLTSTPSIPPHTLQFNFDYALYPENGYFDEGYHVAAAMYEKSHLIVGEGGGCNHYHGLNMTHIAGQSGKILMAPSGPSDFYKANYPSIFGMHLASESYPLATIQQFAFRGVKTAAMIYYGSGEQVLLCALPAGERGPGGAVGSALMTQEEECALMTPSPTAIYFCWFFKA